MGIQSFACMERYGKGAFEQGFCRVRHQAWVGVLLRTASE